VVWGLVGHAPPPPVSERRNRGGTRARAAALQAIRHARAIDGGYMHGWTAIEWAEKLRIGSIIILKAYSCSQLGSSVSVV